MSLLTYKFNAAFTPDTCSPDTICIHLYPFVSPVAVYIVSCIGVEIVVTATRIHLYPLISGYKLLVRDTCIRLHVSGVNAALRAA